MHIRVYVYVRTFSLSTRSQLTLINHLARARGLTMTNVVHLFAYQQHSAGGGNSVYIYTWCTRTHVYRWYAILSARREWQTEPIDFSPPPPPETISIFRERPPRIPKTIRHARVEVSAECIYIDVLVYV